ncbi:MAG: helix-turn-helix domain-containing protein [Candidatus Thermoplasmatota archaeon]|nr:helix-turn-helix domain-containing protein [Candidatus Thermoplasmatota archaeon]
MARLNLKEAADKLNVSIRTLRRRIKEGSVYATLEDGKYYLDSNEVDRLSNLSTQVDTGRVDKARLLSKQMSTPTAIIALDKVEYDRLIYRVGQLEEREQRLLEYQQDRETKDNELSEARQRIEELEKKLLDMKNRSWWKRIFKK